MNEFDWKAGGPLSRKTSSGTPEKSPFKSKDMLFAVSPKKSKTLDSSTSSRSKRLPKSGTVFAGSEVLTYVSGKGRLF